ncbi:MAG: hypothetical protein NVSMB65_03950 [Chloroflexota bacterium]
MSAAFLSGGFLVLASFLASAVEMVEALTIVLAAGVTRGWRSSLIGVGVALVALAAIIAVLGPALTAIPIDVLRLVVGGLLLIFGLQWLRKAIMRSSGYKALHDEAAIFQKERAAAQERGAEVRAGLDWYAFTLCFKGVVLEGLEVAFIVVTFGATAQRDGIHNAVVLATAGAVAALVIVLIVGVLVREPLSQVPENTLKFAVGLLLTSFGTFWAAEGAGADWPGADLAILGLLVVYSIVALAIVNVLRQQKRQATLRSAA